MKALSIKMNKILLTVLFLSFWSIPLSIADNKLNLPNMGSNSGFISEQESYQLGRTWLRMFRNRAPIIEDPLTQDYLEALSYQLATHSDLKSPRLEILIVNNHSLNAFAVPGGVMGFHTGLFHYAKTEAQFASVLAHEIGHLSQQHFARRIETQKRQTPITAAGMLAGILLTATTGSDAGLAAIASTQAAAINQQLQYSRLHEQEADRVAMKTLKSAGFDPKAMANMFEEMMIKTRYAGNKTPEFLLTHPLTESRINDARSKARQASNKVYIDNPRYQLIKTRVAVLSERKGQSAQDYRTRLKKNKTEQDLYGLVLALQKNQSYKESLQQLTLLRKSKPQEIIFIITEAELLNKLNKQLQAIKLLESKLEISPNNYPLSMGLAKLYLETKNYSKAEKLLSSQAQARPSDPYVWYLLAEVRGFTNNILGLHEARAQYFALNGQVDRAIKQLGYALQSSQSTYEKQRIQAHINRYLQLKKDIKKL